MESTRKHWTPHPRESANFFSLFTFTWVVKIFWADYKTRITADNIWSPYSKHRSTLLGDRLEHQWNKQLIKSGKDKSPSLTKALLITFWQEILVIAVILFVQQMLNVLIRPKLLGILLSYFNLVGGADLQTALYSGGGLVGIGLITNLLFNHYMIYAISLGMKSRAACVSLTLKMSKSAMAEVSAGQIINLVSNDISRFDRVAITMNYLWTAPVLFVLVCYFLVSEAGYSGLTGMITIFILATIQTYSAKQTTKFRRQIARRTDERIKTMNEILGGIHVIKMFAWEKAFGNILEWARKKELNSVRNANFLRGSYMTFNLFTTRMALFCTLTAYTLSGQTLNAEKVFVIAAYFGMMSASMRSIFVRGIPDVSECYVSIKRLQKFMLSDEIESKSINEVKSKGKINQGFVNDSNFDTSPSIRLKNVFASWDNNTDEKILKNLNLTISNTQLVGVIGSVGSGKSSLLQLLLGEMKIKDGDMKVNGIVSYMSQESWLFGGTIMQNILLGLPFDKERYEKVIKASSLTRDINLFPKGNQTEVGERGASLSGGQKARINLARAIYKEADIYILDDPLSAVDAHVAKDLFKECFKEFLKGKIVIVATHQLQFMQDCDHVILLNEGRIQDQGCFSEFLKHDNDFGRKAFLEDKPINFKNDENETQPKRRFDRKNSIKSISSEGTATDDIYSASEDVDEFQERQMENVEKNKKIKEFPLEYKENPFLGYLRAGNGQITFIIYIFFLLCTQFFASSCDYFVSYWTTQEELIYASNQNITIDGEKITQERTLNVSIYGFLIFSLLATALTRGIVFFIMCYNSSQGLHTQMVKAVFATDLGYFNKNPSGAILNKFSRDLCSTDEMLPKSMLDCCQVFGQVIGAVIMSMIVNVLFVIPTVIFTIITITIRHYFMKTSLNLKKIENYVRSPVYTHLNESLQGLSTIRAHGSQEFLMKQFDLHQDLHTAALYTFAVAQQAYSYCLDTFGMIYLSCIIFTFMTISKGAHGAEVGLAITQTLVITSLLQWGMRGSSEIANMMTSVERVLSFVLIPEEEKDLDKKSIPNSEWPTKGDIKCTDLIMKYNIEDPPVLNIEKIHIKSGENIGIVGRTGAGKSSFTGALFRLAHLEGHVLIDGVDTSTLPLNFLRSKICIIPQNPVLFSGNLRKNLDPFYQYPDYVLWKALNEVDLHEVLKEGFGLDTKVSEGGSNLSVGQRQLVCLARAIVKNSKIIILDEATASVDPKTDEVIQKTIRKKFDKCTVLAIAHRLNTVIDSDRILVMDAGRIVEFDTPLKLLENQNGYFYKLVQETGSAMASQLVLQTHQV